MTCICVCGSKGHEYTMRKSDLTDSWFKQAWTCYSTKYSRAKSTNMVWNPIELALASQNIIHQSSVAVIYVVCTKYQQPQSATSDQVADAARPSSLSGFLIQHAVTEWLTFCLLYIQSWHKRHARRTTYTHACKHHAAPSKGIGYAT